MKQTLKVWRLTEFNCICLHATLGWRGWLRLGSGLWLGRAGLSSSGARMMVGDNLLMDEHDNHSMVTETYLQDTLSAQFKTSQKATHTGFTPALTYSKLQLLFSFFFEETKILKLIEHSTLASQKTARPPLGTWYCVCGVSLTAKVEATSM